MITLLTLFLEFFKTGLFAVGGGLATIPYLREMAENYPWFTLKELTDMIAVAESTPGPIGVNMATYAGYNASSVLGGIVSTLGLITPSLIIIILVAKILNKFKESKIVKNAFSGLRPAVAGLITAAAWTLFKLTMFKDAPVKFSSDFINLSSLILFAILTFVVLKFKKLNPIIVIIIGAILGIIFKLA